MMKRVAMVALALALAGCGDDEPDLEACEQELRQQFEDALESGKEGERPDECDGVSDEELAEMVERVMTGKP